jgi:membrane protein required for colicin V production
MNWVDYCILALIVISMVIGAIRGFAREALGLATWVFAALLAWFFAKPLFLWLAPYISVPSVRQVTAYASLFLGGLLVGGVITALIADLVRDSRFSSADRTLGAGLGLLRGGLIVALLVLILGMTSLRQDPWWGQSLLIARFEVLAEGLRHLLPKSWLDTLQSAPESVPVDQL